MAEPELRPAPGATAGRTAPRPYYDEGGITIYHGDCWDVLPQLGTEHALVLTDPPYGIGVRYGKGYDDKRGDYWKWLSESVRLMRAAAPVVVFTHRVAALRELREWDWIGVWRKMLATGVRVGNSPLLPHWEPIFLYGVHTLGTKDVTFTQDVFSFNPERSYTGRTKGREGWAKDDISDHPVPKPEDLWRTLLNAFGQAAGPVLDPFMGTGTTLRVAKDGGRRAIGIEIEERYCEIAAKRLGQEVFDFNEAA
jgi:site-specific DNA-methyltransferase (adenine-specific)